MVEMLRTVYSKLDDLKRKLRMVLSEQDYAGIEVGILEVQGLLERLLELESHGNG